MTKTWEEYKVHARAKAEAEKGARAQAEAEKAIARAQASAARGARLREIDRRIAERGLRVESFGSHGAQRIAGDGVDILIASGHWNAVSLSDLEPVRASTVLLGNRYR